MRAIELDASTSQHEELFHGVSSFLVTFIYLIFCLSWLLSSLKRACHSRSVFGACWSRNSIKRNLGCLGSRGGDWRVSWHIPSHQRARVDLISQLTLFRRAILWTGLFIGWCLAYHFARFTGSLRIEINPRLDLCLRLFTYSLGIKRLPSSTLLCFLLVCLYLSVWSWNSHCLSLNLGVIFSYYWFIVSLTLSFGGLNRVMPAQSHRVKVKSISWHETCSPFFRFIHNVRERLSLLSVVFLEFIKAFIFIGVNPFFLHKVLELFNDLFCDNLTAITYIIWRSFDHSQLIITTLFLVIEIVLILL